MSSSNINFVRALELRLSLRSLLGLEFLCVRSEIDLVRESRAALTMQVPVTFGDLSDLPSAMITTNENITQYSPLRY